MLSDNLWLDISILAATLTGWLAFALALFCLIRLRKQAELTEKLFHRLERNLQVANSSAIGVGKRVIALERQVNQPSVETGDAQAAARKMVDLSGGTQRFADKLAEAAKTQEDSVPEPPTLVDSGLRDAAALLQAGLEPEEVARRCGISRAEASLLQLMNQPRPSAA